MTFARWVFLTAGVLGLLPVGPLAYEALVNGADLLPDASEMGLFVVVFLFQYVCWQILFIILAGDPVRYRPMMIPAFFAEITAPLNPLWLFLYGFQPWVFSAVIYLVLAVLFAAAFWLTGREPSLSAA